MSAFAALLLIQAAAANPASTPARPHDVAEKSADNRDKMICKRFVKTGSLVDSYRTCKTKADWDRERDNLRTLNATQSCSQLGQGGSCN